MRPSPLWISSAGGCDLDDVRIRIVVPNEVTYGASLERLTREPLVELPGAHTSYQVAEHQTTIEIIIPRLIPHLARNRADVHESAAHQYSVQMMQDQYNGLFNAALYTPPTTNSPAHIESLDVIERDDQSRAKAHLYADSAIWNDHEKRWDLTNGWKVLIASPDQIHREEEKPIIAYRSDITPDEIWAGVNYLNKLGQDGEAALLAAGLIGWGLHLWEQHQASPGDVVLIASLGVMILHATRDLAVALVASYQGISLLTNTFRDPELMAREGHRLERWVDSLD